MIEQVVIKSRLTTKHGEFTYVYFRHFNKTHNFDTYAFSIWDENGQPEKEKASFILLIMDNNIHLKVIDLYMNDYAGKGIAPAIILEAQRIFKKRIISSSNTRKSFSGEANSPAAIKRVWKPFVVQNRAIYDPINDCYLLLDN